MPAIIRPFACAPSSCFVLGNGRRLKPFRMAEQSSRPLALSWLGALAFALVLAAYANHFDNGFQFDDSHTVADNVAIRNSPILRDRRPAPPIPTCLPLPSSWTMGMKANGKVSSAPWPASSCDFCSAQADRQIGPATGKGCSRLARAVLLSASLFSVRPIDKGESP